MMYGFGCYRQSRYAWNKKERSINVKLHARNICVVKKNSKVRLKFIAAIVRQEEVLFPAIFSTGHFQNIPMFLITSLRIFLLFLFSSATQKHISHSFGCMITVLS